ncbi:hypothetical protein BX600DRAFT_435766 [Xylariales sp. PMI_506]|nr:hypothetical protein BX600DRAFT_435766 [Xylariales sp. PMI_506]
MILDSAGKSSPLGYLVNSAPQVGIAVELQSYQVGESHGSRRTTGNGIRDNPTSRIPPAYKYVPCSCPGKADRVSSICKPSVSPSACSDDATLKRSFDLLPGNSVNGASSYLALEPSLSHHLSLFRQLRWSSRNTPGVGAWSADSRARFLNSQTQFSQLLSLVLDKVCPQKASLLFRIQSRKAGLLLFWTAPETFLRTARLEPRSASRRNKPDSPEPDVLSRLNSSGCSFSVVLVTVTSDIFRDPEFQGSGQPNTLHSILFRSSSTCRRGEILNTNHNAGNQWKEDGMVAELSSFLKHNVFDWLGISSLFVSSEDTSSIVSSFSSLTSPPLILVSSLPCIRGHRSTKCNHAEDRVMVPVRKPGRPLSSCPHNQSEPCSCTGGITAAIPKKKSCACPNTQPQAQTPPIKTEPDMPLSPTSKTSFRVQKPGPKASSRKQSFDPNLISTNLERMDSSSINLVAPFSPTSTTPIQNVDGTGSASIPAFPNGYHGSLGYGNGLPNQPTAGQPNLVRAHQARSSISTTFSAADTIESSGVSAMDSSRTSSCCSGVSGGTRHTPASSAGSISLEAMAPPKIGGSCCGPKAEAVESHSLASYDSSRRPSGHEPGIPPQFPTSARITQQIYNPNYQTIFTYPAPYGTFQQPLQPSVWQQMVALDYNPAQSHINYQASLPMLLQQNGPNSFSTADSIHQCECGPGCECIGCAAHPYNNATQEYVRNAWQSQAFIAQSESLDGIANGKPVIYATTNGGDSPPTIPTPTSDTPPGGLSGDEDFTMNEFPSNEFFHVNYQWTTCAGDQSVCPCGDDCACVGCQVHGGKG